MPRQTQSRTKGRTQVNPQATFDFTVPERQVSARPTDPYVKQYGDSGTKNIEAFMQSFSEMTNSGMAVNETYKKNQTEKGQVSAMKGEAEPERGIMGSGIGGKHWAFIKGYEGFKGEISVKDYQEKMNELFNKSGDLDPQQWNSEKDAINRDFLNGRSDDFIKGFVPRASEVEGKYDLKYHEVLKERVKNKYLTETRQMADLELTRIYNDTTIPPELKGKAVREALSKEQERGKALGMADRNDISKEFVEHYIEQAATLGRPDFLDFAFEEDETGFKLVQRPELADALWAGIRAATSKKTALADKADENLTKAKAEAVENMERTIVWAMETGQYEEAAKALVKGSPYINSEHTQTYLKRLNTLQLDANWAKVDNHDWYRTNYILASEGKMTEALWNEAPQYCTRDTYLDLAKINGNANKASSGNDSGANAMFNKYKDILLKSVAPQDPFDMGVFIDGSIGRERNEEASHLMYMKKAAFLKNHPLSDLTPDELRKWQIDIKADLDERMAAPSDLQMPNNKGKSTTNKGGASKAVSGKASLLERVREHQNPKPIDTSKPENIAP